MRTTLQTPRLILRPFVPADAPEAHAWFADPEVMRFTPTGPDRDLDQTVRRLARFIDHQGAHGFSRWILLNRATGQPLGDAGLMHLPEYGWIDFGYRLAHHAWGRGLATEAASAWRRLAFDEFHLDSLTAFAHPGNSASLRILARLGFLEQRRAPVLGMDSIIFLLRNPNPRSI